jgi:starch phosphorylase
MEASGTGNMKFALNGALTIGTLDGANIEIRDEVGADNIFIFGLRSEQVGEHKTNGSYRPREIYDQDEKVRRVLDRIRDGFFSPEDKGLFRWVFEHLIDQGDRYYLLADFADYCRAQGDAARLFADGTAWAERAIHNVARSGKFSSDRTIRQYAQGIWRTERVADPALVGD